MVVLSDKQLLIFIVPFNIKRPSGNISLTKISKEIVKWLKMRKQKEN
jgi:hypothetical protein